MTFDVEIMLRNDEHVFASVLAHDRPPTEWTVSDAEAILEKILASVARALSPDADEQPISLRGVSWIVNPFKDGVVLALEIHSASAVAGPFAVGQADLERLVGQAVRASTGSPTVH